MKRCCLLLTYIVTAAFLTIAANVSAQVFENPYNKPQAASESRPTTPSSSRPAVTRPTRQIARPQQNKSLEAQKKAEAEDIEEDDIDMFYDYDEILDTISTKRPTTDGVVRGHVSMRAVVDEKQRNREDRYIYVYYSNFDVKTTLSGKVMCDIRFIVMSNIDSKINNLSFRLKWPNMETPISFSNVIPNVETYIDYSLMGDGCYSMDKAPNIIVNKCKIKEMTQQECAQKIRWLRRTR